MAGQNGSALPFWTQSGRRVRRVSGRMSGRMWSGMVRVDGRMRMDCRVDPERRRLALQAARRAAGKLGSGGAEERGSVGLVLGPVLGLVMDCCIVVMLTMVVVIAAVLFGPVLLVLWVMGGVEAAKRWLCWELRR